MKRKRPADRGPLATADALPYCVLLAVSLEAPSFGVAGVDATELGGVAEGMFVVLAVSLAGAAGGALLAGASVGSLSVAVVLIAGWLAAAGAGVLRVEEAAGVTGA